MGLKNIEQMFGVMNNHPGLTWPTPANRIENLRPNTPVRRLELVVLRMYPRRMIASATLSALNPVGAGRETERLW